MKRKNWVETTIGKISTKPQYGWTSRASKNGVVKYLRTTDISKNELNWESVPYCELEPENIDKYRINKGDIFIARSGSVGLSYLVDKEIDFDAVFASYLIRFRPLIVNPKYVFYFLKSNKYWEQIEKSSSGIAVQNVNASKLSKIKIPLAPFMEQEFIVDKLDILFSKLNSTKRRLHAIPKIIEDFKKSMLGNALSGNLTSEWRKNNPNQNSDELININSDSFIINADTRKLTEIPDTWNWVPIGNYTTCKRGRFSARPRNDPQFFDGLHPFIQIGDLPKNGGLITSHSKTLNNEGLKVSKKFRKGTVVIAIVGATIANSGVLSYDTCFPDSLIGIDTENDDYNWFIEYYFILEKENIRNLSYASGGQPNIKLSTLNNYPIPLPPYEEQVQIVRKLNKMSKLIDQLEKKYEAALISFEQIRGSILKQAFSGEMSDGSLDEESVELLLKRVQTAKDKLITSNEMKKYIRKGEKFKTFQNKTMEILEVLQNSNVPMKAKEVWKKSKYKDDIDSFYSVLKNEVDEKRIKESKDKEYLELV